MNVTEITEPVRQHFPISVEIYHVMAERGAFKQTDRVELIGGEIFYMSPIGNLHARCVKFLADHLKGQYTIFGRICNLATLSGINCSARTESSRL